MRDDHRPKKFLVSNRRCPFYANTKESKAKKEITCISMEFSAHYSPGSKFYFDEIFFRIIRRFFLENKSEVKEKLENRVI